MKVYKTQTLVILILSSTIAKKKSTLLLFLLLFSIFQAKSETVDLEKASEKESKIVFQDSFVEAGVLFSNFKDTIPDLLIKPMPYLHFNINNYFSERLLFAYFLTPIAIFNSGNQYNTIKVRLLQVEGGISGSYSPLKNFWISAGAGLAFRFLKQYKMGFSEPWTKTKEHYNQIHIFGTASISWWPRTNFGLQFTTNIGDDYISFRGGLVFSISTVTSKFSKKKKVVKY